MAFGYAPMRVGGPMGMQGGGLMQFATGLLAGMMMSTMQRGGGFGMDGPSLSDDALSGGYNQRQMFCQLMMMMLQMILGGGNNPMMNQDLNQADPSSSCPGGIPGMDPSSSCPGGSPGGSPGMSPDGGAPGSSGPGGAACPGGSPDVSGMLQPGGAAGIPAKYANNPVAQLIWQESVRNGADPYVMLATAIVESGLNPHAVGDGGTSFGLFQYHRGGALGNRSPEWAFNPQAITDDEAQRFAHAGVHSGAGAAAVQRPANRGAYAAKIDRIIAQLKAGG